ncbi:MAG: hypothetical protein L0Z50_29765 [Verrucomicrobiales bacterium]|nr:hypothetical protein [Verrucomicrobiales bacterium]
MKTITKTFLYLQMTAMFLTATFVTYGGATTIEHFYGRVQQVETQIIHR